MNPTIDVYKPAIAIELGVDMKEIPTYNFVKFAMVGRGPDVRILLVFEFRCLSLKWEFVYGPQKSLGFCFVPISGSLSS